MTTYPNREHENADKSARRRALAALDQLANEARLMQRRIEDDCVDGDDSQRIASLARDLTQHLAIIGALREVREWHAADQADGAVAAGAKRCQACGATDKPLTHWPSGASLCSDTDTCASRRDAR